MSHNPQTIKKNKECYSSNKTFGDKEKHQDDSTITRPTIKEIDEILGRKFRVLDHGFIRVVDYMGDDAAIVQAARVSYGKGTKTVQQDRGLINYLMRYDHASPFEMCEIKFHLKMPIFIARQWIRHRTANVNEYSARYSVLDNEFYIPQYEHIASQSADNKQGREENKLNDKEIKRALEILQMDSSNCYDHYREMLNIAENGEDVLDENKQGIAREIARINLTLNTYTQMYWKIDLRNLLHFLKLRIHCHSQFEIREYAKQILDLVKLWVPYTYDAFCDYQLNSFKISAKGKDALARLLNGEEVTEENSGLSKREWNELMSTLL
jgi:thymidylate synthase (FAD)